MVTVCIFGSRNGYDADKIRSVLLKLKQRFGDRLTVVTGDVLGVVRGNMPLRVKYAKRTQQVFLHAYNSNGYFVGFNTSGKGSQLMISFIESKLPADKISKRMVLFD